jgi:hypothetical protein
MSAIKTIVHAWQNNRVRAINIIEKLYQLGLLDPQNMLTWAYESLNTKGTNNH